MGYYIHICTYISTVQNIYQQKLPNCRILCLHFDMFSYHREAGHPLNLNKRVWSSLYFLIKIAFFIALKYVLILVSDPLKKNPIRNTGWKHCQIVGSLSSTG